MENKRMIFVIDPKTEKTLKMLQKNWGINRSAVIRYCINYCGIKIRKNRI